MINQTALSIMQMNPVEKSVWLSQRNQRSFWQNLDHGEWVKFCKVMADWFKKDAADEWDKYVIANDQRKAASDLAGLAAKHGL